MNRICLSGITWYIIRYLRVILNDQIYLCERKPSLFLHFSKRIGAYLIGSYRLISQWSLRVIHNLFLVFQSLKRTFGVLLMESFSKDERHHVQIQLGLSDAYYITSFYKYFARVSGALSREITPVFRLDGAKRRRICQRRL